MFQQHNWNCIQMFQKWVFENWHIKLLTKKHPRWKLCFGFTFLSDHVRARSLLMAKICTLSVKLPLNVGSTKFISALVRTRVHQSRAASIHLWSEGGWRGLTHIHWPLFRVWITTLHRSKWGIKRYTVKFSTISSNMEQSFLQVGHVLFCIVHVHEEDFWRTLNPALFILPTVFFLPVLAGACCVSWYITCR